MIVVENCDRGNTSVGFLEAVRNEENCKLMNAHKMPRTMCVNRETKERDDKHLQPCEYDRTGNCQMQYVFLFIFYFMRSFLNSCQICCRLKHRIC